MSNAKVCTDDRSLCCLVEFVADLTDKTVFSLGMFIQYILFIYSGKIWGVFKGDHTKDGSIAGQFRSQSLDIIFQQTIKIVCL